MEPMNVEGDDCKKSKSLKPIISDTINAHGTSSSKVRLSLQQEAITALHSIASHSTKNSNGTEMISNGSPELTRRISRTEAVRQDAIKLKCATLGKVGKMFKQRSQAPVTDKSSLSIGGTVTATKSVENCAEESSRKEKTNSLGRMLRLVDKDGSPRKLFHPRAGSLSRMLRRQPHNGKNDVCEKPADDVSPGIISRMFSQLRGRPHSGGMATEPSLKNRNQMNSLPPKVPLNSRATTNLSLSAKSSSPTQLKRSSKKPANVEFSI